MKSDIIEKLKKILARADSTRNPSEEEVKTAMAMAQRIAMENNIALGELMTATQDETGEHTIETTQGDVAFKTAEEKIYHRQIFRVIRECFDVHTLWSYTYVLGKQRRSILLFGERADVEIGKFAFGYLETVFPDCMLDWARNAGYEDYIPREVRHSYFEGFASGVIEANRRVEEEAKKEACYALVIQNKEAIVEAAYLKAFPSCGTKRQGRQGGVNMNARSAGHAAGRTIKIASGALHS